ncbi:hemagglutinin [Bdellovibrio sp. ZAP7]|uniref:Ig-like domain-containing protein n=1 Tax=Bdellovibrio sp. ZAP7 TaxID=2231053 RepID=UPI00115C1FFD|nr:Ig-like domain-containing protein [Bdellovibrio sp. ZAP7]QDK44948.1 hemagglutinin [Bdellovibrio sp. ZAP7]
MYVFACYLLGVAVALFVSACSLNVNVKHPSLKAELKSVGILGYYTNQQPVEVLVTFNNPPVKLNSERFIIQNATLDQIIQQSETVYKVVLIPTGVGEVSLTLPPGAAVDHNNVNLSGANPFDVFYDNTIPVIDTADMFPAAVSPNPTPSVQGTTEPGAVITLYNSITCSGQVLGDTKADNSGNYKVEVFPALATEGSYAMSVLAKDAAGNIYCYPLPVAYILDQTAPSIPSISLTYTDISDNPVDMTLHSCTDTNQGGASYYQIAFVPDGATMPALNSTAWTSCAVGSHYVNLPGPDGTHTIRLWVRDEAGNVTVSPDVSVTLDTVTPSLNVISSVAIDRNETPSFILGDVDVSSDEEGAGSYALGTANSPKCSDYGSVTIDSATGEVGFVPTTHYFNRYLGADHNGGPCDIAVRFSDQVTPFPHSAVKHIAVTVNFVDEPLTVTAWPGANGTAAEKCGNKCFQNAVFDLSFTVNPGGDVNFPDPQNVTCSASTADGYYVDIASCNVSGFTGTLSLQMGQAHGSATDTTAITFSVTDGITTVIKSFGVHVDNYVMSMYPALALRNPLSCVLCHATIQADVITDFNVNSNAYTNASGILGVGFLQSSTMYHVDNSDVPFSVTGSIYIPDITVTDKNFIKQATGDPNSSPINLFNFLTNSWNNYRPLTDSQGSILMDTDGFVQINTTPSVESAQLVPPYVQGGLKKKSSIVIRAPSDAEILGLDSSLSASTTSFVFKGPNSKPGLSGLSIVNNGYGNYITNSGTLVCYGSIILSGTVFFKNLNVETDDVGCSIYAAGNIFIETDRAQAIQYTGSATSPTLQITSSKNIHLGVGLYEVSYVRKSNNNWIDAQKIMNPNNPSGLKDAAGDVITVKSNGNASAWEWMGCPLRPEHSLYLDTKYISNGNYAACDPSVDLGKCAYARELFSGSHNAVSGYDLVTDNRVINRGGTLVNPVIAYETMCRLNGGAQMSNYTSYNWQWAGKWGELPAWVGSSVINSYRRSTIFDHVRLNAKEIHSRYVGEFRGSVIAPYALFAVGNLVFKYDTRLNNVVPFPRLMVPTPIFDVQ